MSDSNSKITTLSNIQWLNKTKKERDGKWTPNSRNPEKSPTGHEIRHYLPSFVLAPGQNMSVLQAPSNLTSAASSIIQIGLQSRSSRQSIIGFHT
jgi:hypothetical protein